VSGFARVFMSVALCPSRLPHNRWSAFVGLSTLRFPEIPEEPKKKDAGDGEDRCHAREGALFARVAYTKYVNDDVWTSTAAIFPIPNILFVFL